ncbi:MAG: hydroxymethylglutaryl-CoA lyase [Bacteriovoracaceae bacterium]|nr:hydroxymethylglutaryl-CoA lyase [Bacteriovoracaceae bacterium]
MLEKQPKKIKILEVGPRDGLQNEKQIVSTVDKFQFIKKLAMSGLQNIEASSFVKAQSIPQMSDAVELFRMIKADATLTKVQFSALVPNEQGYQKAREFNLSQIALFTSTSDTFNKKNINSTVDESFDKMAVVAKLAKADKKRLRVYISTAFGCPYEGEISIKKVCDVYERALKLKADEIAVSDTIGVATPKQVKKVILQLKKEFGLSKVALHFHDTRGMALTNILVALEHGIVSFDSAAGGLGGCPYAKGATGNVATEDLLYLLTSLGVKHGVEMSKLAEASAFIHEKIQKQTNSKYLQAYLKSQKG